MTPIRWSVVAAVAMASPLQAQEAWSFQVTPYLWGPGLSGELRPDRRLPTIELDLSLGDILEDLQAAAFVAGAARRGPWVLMADFTYSDLARTERLTIPSTAITPEVRVSARTEVELATGTLAGGRRVLETSAVEVDLLAGVRIWRSEQDLRVPNPLPGVPDDFSVSETWVDPIVAARGRWRIAPDWSATAYADVGGFDIGSGSQLTWQVVATVNYAVSERVSVSAGWRTLALDTEIGGIDLDVELNGPLIGATVRF